MFKKLEAVEKRYEELNKIISDPEVISNQNEWKKYMKEHSDIEEVVLKYREYKKVEKNYKEAKEMLSDPEMKELAEIEFQESKEKLAKIEEEIKIFNFLHLRITIIITYPSQPFQPSSRLQP